MMSVRGKSKSPQDDSVSNASHISTSNVHSLRKIFENNFKLHNLTNAFKPKSKLKSDVIPVQNSEQKESREVECTVQKSVTTPLSTPHENYLNCNLPNCCCKTFFRVYNNTPSHRYNKTPLRDCSSEMNKMSQSPIIPDRTRSTLGKENNNHAVQISRNKVYQIQYEFYKPKSGLISELLVPEVNSNTEDKSTTNSESRSKFRFNKLDGINQNHMRGKVFKFKAEKENPKKSYGFVKFTTTSMNEAGYLKVSNNAKNELEENTENANLVNNSSFKHRAPKTCSSIRETSHPYAARKSRLTVKGVKNRNLRNMKQRQKHRQEQQQPLGRSRTFSGFDNFAFRPSLTHLQCSRSEDENQDEIKKNDSFCRSSANSKDISESSKFHCDSRMNGYDLPITSFYIGANDLENENCNEKPNDLVESKISSRATINFTSEESNLKRHCSLGYLDGEEEEYNFRFARNRRSLGNISSISSKMYTLRSVPDVTKEFKSKKLHRSDIDAQVLFSAVEHGQLDKAKKILESSNVDVNSFNSDNLSPLDVAVLSNNKALVKLLISYGAEAGHKYPDANSMRHHLQQLLFEAENRVQDLNNYWLSGVDPEHSCYSEGNFRNESKTRTHSIWERRAKGLARMLKGFEQIEIPDPPSSVNIEVTSVTSIKINFSLMESSSSIATKIIIQWSTNADFSSFSGYYEIFDMRMCHFNITNLVRGQKYFIRVACGNIKGLSVFKTSSPAALVTSSWRDFSKLETRFNDDMKDALNNILNQISLSHPDLTESLDSNNYPREGVGLHRKKKTTLKQLFTASSKFQKNLRRGVFLSCLFYHDDKILVTTDDFLPIIEIDENYPKNFSADLNWFLKVACNWIDIKWLKNNLEKSETSSMDFRVKLLNAASQMQTALNNHDLGKLYHKVLRDREGTTVICLINCVASSKSISFLNLRWLPVAKLIKKSKIIHEAQSSITDILLSSIPDQVAFHQACDTKLPRGLYLSFVKMRNSVDSLKLIVPSRIPNILPHYKIRNNPHVTAEEWQWLTDNSESKSDSSPFSSQQHKQFIEQIALTARKLFRSMELPEADICNQRLYDVEVIEVNVDVSLILLIPPVETLSAVADQKDLLLQRSDLMSLPIQLFEMTHFTSYQPQFVNLYSKLSCIIGQDIDFAQHELRQAFYSSEVCVAKNKLSQLEELQSRLNAIWKKSHWLLEVITFARNRSMPTRNIFEFLNSRTGRNTLCRNSKRSINKSRGETTILNTTPKDTSPAQMLSPSCPIQETSYSSSRLSDKSYNSNKTTPSNDSMSATTRKMKIQDTQAGTAILQIHAAYTTGPETQRLFKFHVSHRTTVREIVDMFIKQTNMSTLLKDKGGPVYSEKETKNFCLVVVSNARERCLPDDFKPMFLEQPWINGRLYVRRRNKVWAALKLDSKQPKQPSYV